MDTSKINTASLRNLIKLAEKRETLLDELTKLDADIADIMGGSPAKTVSSAPVKTKRKARKARKTRATRTKAKAPAATPAAKAPAAKAASRKSTGKRGALKKRILAALDSAGPQGVKVKDLSKKLGVKSQNIHVWFSSTGKKFKEIEKVSPGHFRLKA